MFHSLIFPSFHGSDENLCPFHASLAMISPGWASTFASPPAAMSLAMATAGVGGGGVAYSKNTSLRCEMLVLERRASRLCRFTRFQKSHDLSGSPQPVPKDKEPTKATFLVAA